MKKIKIIGIEFFVLLVLILIPLVNCYDFDGDGIDDGEQNMCGDNFCQSTESVTSCPSDCTSSSALPSSPTTNPPANNDSNNISNPISGTGSNDISSNQPASAGNLPTENVFFVSTTFKIIILIFALIVIGLIIYFLIRKKKNKNLENSTSGVSNSQ
jgi:hypothetical protein